MVDLDLSTTERSIGDIDDKVSGRHLLGCPAGRGSWVGEFWSDWSINQDRKRVGRCGITAQASFSVTSHSHTEIGLDESAIA